MPAKTYIVRFKPPELSSRFVTAASFQIQGEHLVFLNSKDELAALFLLEELESWDEIEGETGNEDTR
jgi:hypothetical protein